MKGAHEIEGIPCKVEPAGGLPARRRSGGGLQRPAPAPFPTTTPGDIDRRPSAVLLRVEQNNFFFE